MNRAGGGGGTDSEAGVGRYVTPLNDQLKSDFRGGY